MNGGIVKHLRVFVLVCLLLPCMSGWASAEGFAMTEWSARGLGLAGGLVGRADDPSALAYNAAGITQLPGTHIMGGVSVVAPYGSIEARYADGDTHTSHVKPDFWAPFHGYLTHQYNDNVWFGLGIFTRFGLGNGYSGDWFGRYNVYDVALQTVSVVPTVAYKINDMFSLSLGVEAMYLHLYEGIKVPTASLKMMGPYPVGLNQGPDTDLQVEGQGMGFGVHAGLHMRFSEQWSAGLAYKSQVTQTVYGNAEFSPSGKNLLATLNKAPRAYDSDVSGTVQLPDSLAFGIAWKPMENLSFEVGGIWTRWSTYNSLNIYFDQPSGYRSISEKNWKDGWNFNASVEYKPVDWLALRLGFWHETSVIDEAHADFMLPTNGRDVLTLGTGFKWGDWTLDLAYAHIWIYPTSYNDTDGSGIRGNAFNGDVIGGKSKNTKADIYSVSLGYTF